MGGLHQPGAALTAFSIASSSTTAGAALTAFSIASSSTTAGADFFCGRQQVYVQDWDMVRCAWGQVDRPKIDRRRREGGGRCMRGHVHGRATMQIFQLASRDMLHVELARSC